MQSWHGDTLHAQLWVHTGCSISAYCGHMLLRLRVLARAGPLHCQSRTSEGHGALDPHGPALCPGLLRPVVLGAESPVTGPEEPGSRPSQ